MKAALSKLMAASVGMLAASMPEAHSFASFDYQRGVLRMLGVTDPTRTRSRGRHRPAGTKLARKAFKGRVGLATIR